MVSSRQQLRWLTTAAAWQPQSKQCSPTHCPPKEGLCFGFGHSARCSCMYAHANMHVAGQGPDEVAAGLLDLMGDAAFEQVGALLEKR